MQKRWIVGLGNPGKKYERTRHNAGFLAVQRLAESLKASDWREKHQSVFLRAGLAGTDVQLTLILPQTFMNLSGDSLADWKRRDGLDPAGLMVVYDDMDLPQGKTRLRASGSGGSHNGMASIIERLASDQFARLRLGIGKPADPAEWADFVTGRFKPDEEKPLGEMLDKAVLAIQDWAKGVPFERLMGQYNA